MNNNRIYIAIIAACFVVIAIGGVYISRTATLVPPMAASAGPGPATEALIEKETAALALPPPSAPLVSAQALKARAALKRKDYASAEAISAAIRSASRLQYGQFRPYRHYVEVLAGGADAAYAAFLDGWCAAYPKSANALLARAQYRWEMGWAYRGQGTSSTLANGAGRVFATYLGAALTDIQAAIALDPGNAYAYFLKLDALAGQGNTPDAAAAFAEGAARFPDYADLYVRRLYSLEPKWGGSVQALYEFVAESTKAIPRTSPRSLLPLNLYSDLVDTAAMDCSRYGTATLREACVAAAMRQLVTPDLEKQVVTALAKLDGVDLYLFSERIGFPLKKLVDRDERGSFAGAVLQMAASGLNANNELVRPEGATGNYKLDEMAGHVWSATSSYNNAATKNFQALADAKNTSFPDDEAKYSAIGEIYANLGEIYGQSSDYSRAITYLNAAASLGYIDGHGRCTYYYKLGDYKAAIEACTTAYDQSGDREALFWRAETYVGAGNPDAALVDYTILAFVPDFFGSSATITASKLIGDRKDYSGQLKWLNDHAFVFDERAESDDMLSRSYNNRCYAEKQLGQLQAALDDCTISLRHGSLPDAFQKQKELVAALKK